MQLPEATTSNQFPRRERRTEPCLDDALTVQDFTFGPVTPPLRVLHAGANGCLQFSVMPVGAAFASAVTLSCAGAPANPLAALVPTLLLPATAQPQWLLTVSTTGSTAQDNYSLVVTGTSGSLSHSVTFLLTIANSFTLAAHSTFSLCRRGRRSAECGGQNLCDAGLQRFRYRQPAMPRRSQEPSVRSLLRARSQSVALRLR